MQEKGQVILILLLVMSVALGIGLSVVQRSLTDLSTSSKVEQSSRAFSAAEAGIESALQKNLSTDISFTVSQNQLQNQSSAEVVVKANLPQPGQALEYPAFGKEEIAHVWLVAPSDLNSAAYDGTTLNIYWGNSDVSLQERPAIELTLIYQENSNNYLGKKFFIDNEPSRRSTNGFSAPNGGCSHPPLATSLSSTLKSFYCRTTINVGSGDIPSLKKLMLVRARLLYTNIAQSFAVAPSAGKSLPPQATLITSTGVSGTSSRSVQLFQVPNVVPFYFDYAVFAAGEINK